MNYLPRLFFRCDSNVRLNYIYYYWLWWLLIVNVRLSFIYLPSAAPLQLNSIWLSLFAEDINDTSNYLEPCRSLFIILPSILFDLIPPFLLIARSCTFHHNRRWKLLDSENIFAGAGTILLRDENEKKFLITSLIVYEQKSNEHETDNYSSSNFFSGFRRRLWPNLISEAARRASRN